MDCIPQALAQHALWGHCITDVTFNDGQWHHADARCGGMIVVDGLL